VDTDAILPAVKVKDLLPTVERSPFFALIEQEMAINAETDMRYYCKKIDEILDAVLDGKSFSRKNGQESPASMMDLLRLKPGMKGDIFNLEQKSLAPLAQDLFDLESLDLMERRMCRLFHADITTILSDQPSRDTLTFLT
jgi:hypothetical protein